MKFKNPLIILWYYKYCPNIIKKFQFVTTVIIIVPLIRLVSVTILNRLKSCFELFNRCKRFKM